MAKTKRLTTKQNGSYIQQPRQLAQHAAIKSMAEYKKLYAQSLKSPATFWAQMARNHLDWIKPFTKTLQWTEPHAKWFLGGRLNVSINCLDRHLQGHRRHKAAIIAEGEPGDVRIFTYQQLHTEVCRFANVLKKNGVKLRHRVIIYMPNVPEAAIAMLACARIGAIHSVVFGGFSAAALRDRIQDCDANIVVTADGGFRRGQAYGLKSIVDEALAEVPSVTRVIVLRRTGQQVTMRPNRDVWWHEEMATVSSECPAASLDSEHPLFILYTSGSTGKPKGLLHTTAGYLLGAHLTTKFVFDVKDSDLFWCTADVGWITGHTYTAYGALSNGATTLMYEGVPNQPRPDRYWDIIERHRVTIFYTAPTAIRSFIRAGDEWVKNHDLASLRLLGSVGEPINPEAWRWYYNVIGKCRCPIMDTWWQTETGSHAITPLPGVTPLVPGSATLPFLGIDAAVVDGQGKELRNGENGFLVIRKPWPSMARTIWGDSKRYKQVYWSQIKGVYFTGDGARRDKQGYFWITGRIDDVLNISGHRIGTAEVESALVSHPKVAEAAAVGIPHELKGQSLAVFVTLKNGICGDEATREELRQHVARQIGAIAKPDKIVFTEALPKTRSGKIMRRLLREIATGSEIRGDVTTLEDFSVISRLKGIED